MIIQSNEPDLTIVILTYNESIHIQRAIKNAFRIATQVIVVDSFSTDDTVRLATILNAKVVQHPFVNQAQQFQWAMDQGLITTTWTMRLDADEYLTDELIDEIKTKLNHLSGDISGVELKRRVYFMGQWIRHGGYYPIHLLRIWRTGHAVIEQRWMDEHTYLTQGKQIVFQHDFIDDNLQSLTWWTDKHNQYATREAIDLLRLMNHIKMKEVDNSLNTITGQASSKRWYKNNLYLRLPPFFRAFLYFNFRFWFKLGFLDGRQGLIWHFLQGFWYRFLVDAKITQIKWYARTEKKSMEAILAEKFNIII